jgi:MAPEG family
MMKEQFPTPRELQGALQGTLLYLALYLFVFIQYQSYSKFYLVKQKRDEARAKDGNATVSFCSIIYYNSKDMLALSGDRTVGNFVEQAFLFLPLMWLHAVFVNPTQSFTICCIYTASRSIYPVVFQMKPPSILLSTAPGYAILMFLLAQLAKEVLNSKKLSTPT